MTFLKKDIHAIGGTTGNAPALYSYTTEDTAATVNTAGYFNDLAATLNLNDIIFVASSTGGTSVVSLMYVLSNDGAIVDVTDGTVLAATDSD
jgi:hypothetical protein